ncbi:glycosyltransferase family 4 protein [Tersicoccus phoenicis]|uniref:glycosyltransferase family 4 protein n=1 Tax=Tersicoccus phoenicis TaxID=554083 RepID=UPI001F43105A|nr:glycosyltransferase family 4 protein [Tersicoccus phoenicis]
MTGAISALDGEGRAARALQQRLISERQVLSGWAPRLPSAPVDPIGSRVLHLLTNSLPHTGSGYAQRSHSILLAQQHIGLDPLAVTRIGYPVLVGRALASDRDVVDGVPYQRLLEGRLPATTEQRLQRQAEAVLRLGEQFRPAVVHTTTDFTNALVGGAVARSLGVPWVYEVRGMLADTWASTRGEVARHSERYRLSNAREAEAMCAADLVITLGEEMRARIMEAGVDPARILLAPNGVGGPFLEEPLEPREARKQLGLDLPGPVIGTVSSLVDYEGLDTLIDATAVLAPSWPTLHLMIVGSGAAEAALRQRAARAGLTDRITFVGRVPRAEAAAYHQALDIFVVPRRDLSVTRTVTPLKPVEASASARPVVASDLPALREVVQDGRSGLLVTPEDAAALAMGLRRLLSDAAERVRMGRAGRAHVLAHRTWEANARSCADAYEKVRGRGQGNDGRRDGID